MRYQTVCMKHFCCLVEMPSAEVVWTSSEIPYPSLSVTGDSCNDRCLVGQEKKGMHIPFTGISINCNSGWAIWPSHMKWTLTDSRSKINKTEKLTDSTQFGINIRKCTTNKLHVQEHPLVSRKRPPRTFTDAFVCLSDLVTWAVTA